MSRPLTCADLYAQGIDGFADHDPLSQSPTDSRMCFCCSEPHASEGVRCAGEVFFPDGYDNQKCGFTQTFVSSRYLDDDGKPVRVLVCCKCWDEWMPKVEDSVSIPALFDAIAEAQGWDVVPFGAEPQVAEVRA